MKKIIIIPTYNEKENINNLILKIIRLYKSSYDILVIDDNSPDKTARQVKNLKKRFNFIKCVVRKKKLGIGSAHKHALKYAYKKKYSLIITMDADGTHNPRYINSLIKYSKKFDLVTTSRFLKKSSLHQWPFLRRFITFMRHVLLKFILKMPIDASGAYRCYNSNKIKINDILKAKNDGYSFFWESIFILYKKKYSIHQIAIDLPYRSIGSSKMKVSDIFGALLYLFKIDKKNL